MNEVVDHLGIDYNVDIKEEKETEFRASFPSLSMRFGLSFGFAF